MTFEEYFKLEESKLRNTLAAGALAASSFLGSPSDSQASYDNIPRQEQSVKVSVPVQDIPKLWSMYYQSSNDPVKERRAREAVESSFSMTRSNMDAINTAVYIFGGDMGVKPEVLRDFLIYTGYIESHYKHKRQVTSSGKEDGVARSYWQVEPFTAVDLLRNSRPLFGRKFREIFGEEILQLGQYRSESERRRNQEILGDMLVEDPALGASFAAVKWIVSASKELSKY